MDGGTTDFLYSVTEISNKNIIAAGNNGTILQSDGSTWTAMTSGTTATFFGLWNSGSNNVTAVGTNGIILRYNGTAWER